MSRWENKYVIGLTGNIAVGKSYVRQMLQHLGAYPIDADQLSHQAIAPGAPGYKQVVDMFGRFVVDPDGRINRARLGAVAFTLPEALAALESIIHPLVRQGIHALVTRAKQPVIVVEAIKLLEGDLANAVDSIWVVDASPETQIRRLLEKRNMTADEARKRIGAQPPQAEKLKRANVVITNDGSPEDTWRQVQTAYEEVLRRLAPPAPQPAAPQRPAAQPLVKPISVTSTASAASAAPPPIRPTMPAQPAAAQAVTPQPIARPAAALGAAQRVSTGRLGEAGDGAVSSPLLDPKTQIVIRRGMPGNAEAIANFINKVAARQVSRMDIMLAFGQKSFLLAYGKGDALIGVVGWQVENLITRVDEFYVATGVPKAPVLSDLIGAVEDASKELQSEVSFVVLPRALGPDVGPSLVRRGYVLLKLEEIRFPAWREAAQDLLTVPASDVLIKPLRADRVMKPI
ncbi:MAG: dephospho-CoA kinase [Chloroflexi bacterium]|nr:dephospho-CoA kinase [Chloroflexota bacterium]